MCAPAGNHTGRGFEGQHKSPNPPGLVRGPRVRQPGLGVSLAIEPHQRLEILREKKPLAVVGGYWAVREVY